MIVTIANAKGGVAKTTSAIYLACAYARRFDEEAVILDADPQSSASLWRDMAEDQGEPLDGVDVRELSFDALAAAVGVVSQEPYLLHASVADNLRFAKPDATDDEQRVQIVSKARWEKRS